MTYATNLDWLTNCVELSVGPTRFFGGLLGTPNSVEKIVASNRVHQLVPLGTSNRGFRPHKPELLGAPNRLAIGQRPQRPVGSPFLGGHGR